MITCGGNRLDMNLSLMHIICLQKFWTQLWDDDDGGGDEQLWGVFFLSP